MKQGIGPFLGVAALLTLALSASAQVTSEYEMSAYILDTPPPDIERYIAADDLVAYFDTTWNGYFEGGNVDPANNVKCFNFNYSGCLEQFDGVENAFAWPVSAFWHSLPDPSPATWMPNFTDGTGIFAVPLRDFARASNVIRYDFDTPTDIGSVLVWTEFDQPTSGRVFMNYDVFVSYDDSTTGMTPLAVDVRNGEWGISTNVGARSSYTHVYNCDGGPLATGVRKIRFVFYPVTYDNADLFADAWRGYWHPANPAWWQACEATFPADPRDADGRQKTFVSSWVAEIDVLAPETLTPGDATGDGVVNAQDVAALFGALTGPDNGPLASLVRPLDYPVKDCDIDLYDVAQFQAAY